MVDMFSTGFHGTDHIAHPHVGMCITDSRTAAERYAADKNGGGVVTEYRLALAGLTVEGVDYDFDGGEPVIPDDCEADAVTYVDSDMYGHDHDSIMLLTDAAVSAATVSGSTEIEDD